MSFLGSWRIIRKRIRNKILRKWKDNRKTLLGEINDVDVMSGPGISVVKVSYEIQNMYAIPWFPRVVFDPKTFPLYKETQFLFDVRGHSV